MGCHRRSLCEREQLTWLQELYKSVERQRQCRSPESWKIQELLAVAAMISFLMRFLGAIKEQAEEILLKG